jgi:hypothetical protein
MDINILKDKLRQFHKEGKYLMNGGDNDTSKGFLVPIIEFFKL